MKKNRIIIVISFLLLGIILSCKKSETSKDYGASIKDKTWWGTLINAGETTQYYSVHYNADNSLVWSQLSGDYTGIWTLDGNKLTLNFTSLAVKLTAEISDDNKLLNITTNTANKVKTGKLNENTNTLLDNTIWKDPSNSSSAVQLSFFSGEKVETKIGPTTYAASAYIRSSSGFIRFTTYFNHKFFGVCTSDNELSGSYDDSGHSWQIVKQ